MVLNIWRSRRPLSAFTNGGIQESRFKADLPGFFPVWFNPNSMLKILLWSDVQKRFCITVDTGEEAFICVHLNKDKIMYFDEVQSGLYMFRRQPRQLKHKLSGYSFLTLTAANMSQFNKSEIDRAEKAKRLHASLRYPGYKCFFWLLRNHKIKECKIDLEDAKRALHIYGPNVDVPKGKTVRQKSSKINEMDTVDVPEQLINNNKNVYLYADFMYVQGIPILTMISSGYNFRMVDPFPHKNKANQNDRVAGLKRVVQIYKNRGLRVVQIAADNEFECVRDDLSPVYLNITAVEEHVNEVEQSIRTIKEQTRCQIHHLPFRNYPCMLTMGAVIFAIKALNSESGMSSLSKDLFPMTLITGMAPPIYNTLMELSYGDYVQTHNAKEVTNTTTERTNDSIALYPSGNGQEGWRFLSLSTGRIHHR